MSGRRQREHQNRVNCPEKERSEGALCVPYSIASARYYQEQGHLLLHWASASGDEPKFVAKLEALAHEYLLQASLLEQAAVRDSLKPLLDSCNNEQRRNDTPQ